MYENWLVEEEIVMRADLDIREVYISLLQKVIEGLREEKTQKIGDEVETVSLYSPPTVIFAFLDSETPFKADPEKEKGTALAQLYCYRDRREFLKDLAHYGDEDYLTEYKLRDFVGKNRLL